MDHALALLLVATGLIAGLIDSIAGGGGLITVPLLSIVIGPGATAIGTNKVAAVASSLAALLIYFRNGHVSIRGNRRFALIVGLTAGFGALSSPLIPPETHRWLLIVVCPLLLFVVIRKDLWLNKPQREKNASSDKPQQWIFWMAGAACGFYDGIAGPGGGTLMFLSLFLLARLPILAAMATAKVANLASASVSLAAFASTDHVVWPKGMVVAIGISVGALIGAGFASKNAAVFARFALVVVASLLLLRLISS